MTESIVWINGDLVTSKSESFVVTGKSSRSFFRKFKEVGGYREIQEKRVI